MQRTKLILTLPVVLATMGVAPRLQAQSADSLIDKLVDKGILTVKEANELREETDKGFNSAYQVKTGLPDWVTSFKIGGDFRGRFENFNSDNPAFVDRNRFRYRLRLGAVATIKDNFEVGLRLTSGEPVQNFGGDPISGNTTFSDNASKKFVYVDLAYGKWSPVNNANWSGTFTVGKMENPFVFSDMVFDGDYTPEGLAQQFAFNLTDQHSLKLNLGEFILDEVGNDSDDTYMLGAQLRLDSAWTHQIATSVGISALTILNEQGLRGGFSTTTPARFVSVTNTLPSGAIVVQNVQVDNASSATTDPTVPDVNRGNTRSADGWLLNNYNPLVADAGLTYTFEKGPMYNAAFPVRIGADVIYNPSPENRNIGYSVGLTLGKSGKKGLWDLSYRWKHLEGDAWYEEMPDSDFGAFYQSAAVGGRNGYGSGTNVEGHIFKLTYSPFDSLTLGMTYLLTRLIDEVPAASNSDMGRLQVDAIWKF